MWVEPSLLCLLHRFGATDVDRSLRVQLSSDVCHVFHALVFPMNRQLRTRTSRLGLHGAAQKMRHKVWVRPWLPLHGVQASPAIH